MIENFSSANEKKVSISTKKLQHESEPIHATTTLQQSRSEPTSTILQQPKLISTTTILRQSTKKSLQHSKSESTIICHGWKQWTKKQWESIPIWKQTRGEQSGKQVWLT